MTRWFYAFIVINLLIAIMVSMLLVAGRAENSIFQLLSETNKAQAQLASTRFEEFIRGRLTLLNDLSRRPLSANAVMGTSNSISNLDDFMQDFTLLGSKEAIFLIDIFGGTVRSYHFDGQPFPFKTKPWLEAMVDGEAKSALLLENLQNQEVFVLVVPIVYGQHSEGAIAAILKKPAAEILQVAQLADNAAYQIKSPYFNYTSQPDLTQFQRIVEKQIDRTGVRLEYLVSNASINEQKQGFMVDVGIGIGLSLLATFSLLAIFGRSFLLNPYLKLENKQKEVSDAQQRNDLLVAAINASPIGVSIADATFPDQPLTYVNSAFELMTGYSSDEIIGKNCRFLSGSETNQDKIEKISSAIRNAEEISLELINYRKNGEAFWNLLQVSPVFDKEQQLVAFVGIQQDISKQKYDETILLEAKDAAVAAAATKSSFLANMSHEIRTPMNGIIGMLALALKSESLDGQVRQRLDIANRSADSLLVLINDILDFSKIEAGKLTLERLEFDLPAMLSEFARGMAIHAHKKGLNLVLDASDMDNRIVLGDANRIRQVLANIVFNATKFTEQGEVIIRASTDQLENESIRFTCSVQDTGIGIAPNQLRHIFESFDQADVTTTRKYGGTGLGLTIAKQLCMLMGGSIDVVSVVGGGSTFTVTFQLQSVQSSQNDLQPNMNDGIQTVWVIERHEPSRQVIKRQLEKWGKRVIAIATYPEAAALLDSLDSVSLPQLAFVEADDLKSDGIGFCESLANSHKLPGIKIVTMSNVAADMDADTLLKRGVHKNINKPATPSDLFDTLNLIEVSTAVSKTSQSGLSNTVRILLVEDNLINQEVALGILEDLGLEAERAENGRVALDMMLKANEDHYDLILMDCQMPDMDGYEATRAIREGLAGDHYTKIPVLAMTANAMTGDREKCLASGMDDYLSKPIDDQLLEQKLYHYLRQ